MPELTAPLLDRLVKVPPFNHLSTSDYADLGTCLEHIHAEPGDVVFHEGAALPGLFIVEHGTIDIFSAQDNVVSHRGPGDIMGERGLLRDGLAMLTAKVSEPADLLILPADQFFHLTRNVPEIGAWFERATPSTSTTDESPYAAGLMAIQVADLMAKDLLTCSATASVRDVAEIMRAHRVSSVLVMQDTALQGIVTVHDLVNKVLAEGLGGDMIVGDVMTANPITIGPEEVGLDAMLIMGERRISHLPVADDAGRIVGMIGRTDLFRQQSATASHMASEIVSAETAGEMGRVMRRLPDLLTHLTAAGTRPAAICRRITDLTDVITRRLLVLAEARLGPAPVPYVWAACGSQGRREQTGVSDQDNCLIIDDRMTQEHEPYFKKLADFVCDGLNETGFVYCPGEMMASNPRWRQPAKVWRKYFADWVSEPDEEAQMLASVMFDLRPISGETSLFDTLQSKTLKMAKENSIFVRHMIGNSLKHTPPLSFFGGLSLIRSGEHKNRLDLKLAGVVPIVDLGRVYALKGAISALNTRERIKIAGEKGVLSGVGARDLLDAYDLIAETRLRHQALQIQAGNAPDNFFDPTQGSELERNHLRDAFMVVKTMQSALGSLF
ncbi:MAG: DUF294 nucleotidyltransferase-like domain-containing protein [Pseudomonadota bacterium]